MQLSEEERARRAEVARRLHQEAHPDDPNRKKFGGPQPGSGRPRVKRASTLAAEEAVKYADKIVDAFKRGVESPDERTAVMSAKTWLDLEQKEAALQLDEEAHLESMDRGELIKMLAEGFTKLQTAGIDVLEQQEEVVEAVVVEDDDSINPFMVEAPDVS